MLRSLGDYAPARKAAAGPEDVGIPRGGPGRRGVTSAVAMHPLHKEPLQGLADRLEAEARVAHYPPSCSKYNPIELRLFRHLMRACRG